MIPFSFVYYSVIKFYTDSFFEKKTPFLKSTTDCKTTKIRSLGTETTFNKSDTAFSCKTTIADAN